MRCVSAVVHAVVTWSREASDTRFQDRLKCDHWEMVVPELVFDPDAQPRGGTSFACNRGAAAPSKPGSSNRVSLVLWFNSMSEDEAHRKR